MPTHTLGGRVQEARERLGIGQAEMARRVGVVTTTAWRWEHDRSVPRPSDLERLADALGVSKVWLETGEDPSAESASLDPTGT